MFKHKKMRNQELMHDFKLHLAHAFEQGDYRTREELINKTLQSCRPKYDVSFDYALRMMYVMIRDGKPCPARRKNKQEMWKEIRAHVVRTQKRRNCTIAEAVASVLAQILAELGRLPDCDEAERAREGDGPRRWFGLFARREARRA